MSNQEGHSELWAESVTHLRKRIKELEEERLELIEEYENTINELQPDALLGRQFRRLIKEAMQE